MNKYILLSIFCFIVCQLHAMNEVESDQELIARAHKQRSDGFPQKTLSALCPYNTIQITLAPLDEGKLATPTLMIEKDGIQYEKEMKRFYYQAVAISGSGKRFAVIYYKSKTTHTGKRWLEIQKIALKRNENGKNVIVTQKKDKRDVGPFCATVLAFNKQETAVMSNNIGIWRDKDIDVIFPLEKNEAK